MLNLRAMLVVPAAQGPRGPQSAGNCASQFARLGRSSQGFFTMHAILLTVLALNGADAVMLHGGGSGNYGACDECDACGDGGRQMKNGRGGWFGPMPQTCYNPSFGCYPSTRYMSRYPAFHGTYYRNAYNYRNYFDYPWHAGLHEPTSHFSYHVPAEGQAPTGPTPVPAAARAPQTGPVRSATAETPDSRAYFQTER